MSVTFHTQPTGLVLSGDECKVKLRAGNVFASEAAIGGWAYFKLNNFISIRQFTIVIDGKVFSFNLNAIAGNYANMELYLAAMVAEMNAYESFSSYAFAQVSQANVDGTCVVILPVIKNIKSILIQGTGFSVDVYSIAATVDKFLVDHMLGVKIFKSNFSTELIAPGDTFPLVPVREKINASIELPSYSEVVENGDAQSISTYGFIDVDIREFLQQTKLGHYNISTPFFAAHEITSTIIMLGYEKYLTGSSSAMSNAFTVLQGFLPKYADIEFTDNYSSFSDYMLRNKKFLSFQPKVKESDIYAIEHVNFYNFSNKVAARCMVKIYYSDATDETSELAYQAINSTSIYSITVGVLHNLPLQDDKTPIKYELWVEYNSVAITEVRTYIISYKYQNQARYFIYKNSLGVYETIRTTGVFKKDVPITKELVELSEKEYLQVDMSYKMKMKGSTGAINKAWAASFIEMMASDDVRMLVLGQAIPVTMQAGTFDRGQDGDYLLDIPISMEMIDFRENLIEDFANGNAPLPIAGDFAADYAEDFN